MSAITAIIQRKPLTLSQRERIDFYLSITPWLIGLIFFTGGPIIVSFVFSFTRLDRLEFVEFVGFANFQKLIFEDDLFWIGDA